jgi:protein TonB
MISFSNIYERDALLTGEYEKEKFTKWFRTIVPNGTQKAVIKKDIEESELGKQNEKPVFTKVENEAAFPGGNGAWARYMERALGSFDAGKAGAAPGKYVVIVRFVVSNDGVVSDVEAETNHGYGMEEISIKIIKNGPRWKPALQNGRNVNAYHRQSITFIVEDKN